MYLSNPRYVLQQMGDPSLEVSEGVSQQSLVEVGAQLREDIPKDFSP